MFYKYDDKTLRFTKVSLKKLSIKWITIIGFGFFIFGFSIKTSSKSEDFSEKEANVILLKNQIFTKEKLVEKIKSLNFKFPHIVYAQAILESGDFKSKMFLENHNLFGMKEATVRINTAIGTQNEHACYDNWKESLYDYALYSARYLSVLATETDYFEYLSQFYAQDKEYVSKLKRIIERENLKQLFTSK